MVKVGHYEVVTELFYWDNFVWVDKLTDTELLIGITDYAQQYLKDITSITPPSNGQRFASGSDLLTIESISKEYLLKSPVSCVIQELNSNVIDNPDQLNVRPFESWLVRVEVLDHGDLDLLIDGEDMADNILDEVGLETRASSSESKDFSDDFDYESEFSIDSGEDYDVYDGDKPNTNGDHYSDDDYDDDW
ncbi:MAG: glycine cleavage system protein H [Candidatus Heimdallarchaeota archaeon]|nr:glycine cleavage system protein H [Candidatus Heimdallarchaeota archaeon]